MPFAAYKHYGDTFKWMLYGDDDTLFYMPGDMQALLDVGMFPCSDSWLPGAAVGMHEAQRAADNVCRCAVQE